MESLFDKNLEIISKRWPGLAGRISQSQVVSVNWDTQTLVVSMEVSGLRMHSAFDPLKEAEIQLQGIPGTAKEVTLYGIGLGFLQRIALELLPQAIVRAVPMNLGIFRSSLEAVDHRDWLQNERCELIDPALESDVRFPFAAVPACLQLASAGMERLRDQVILELNTPFLRRESTVSQARRRQQIEDNKELIIQDGDVSELFSCSNISQAVVAAAGPTLLKALTWISMHRATIRLIAVDAALRPLLDAGIVPDIVIAADGDRDNLLKYFRGDLERCKHVPLVYLPVVHHDVLKLWPGPRLSAYTDSPLFNECRRQYPRGCLYMSGSVAHSAVDLAVKMGVKSIVLLGFDFSFPGEAVHANPDIAVEELRRQSNTRTWVLDGYGKKIPSAANLIGYLRDLERYIEKHSEVFWSKIDRDGALISGVDYIVEKE